MKQEVLERLKDVLDENVLPQVEIALEGVVKKHAKPAAKQLLSKLAEVIPGKLDDALLLAAEEKLAQELENLLLGLVEKVSDKV